MSGAETKTEDAEAINKKRVFAVVFASEIGDGIIHVAKWDDIPSLFDRHVYEGYSYSFEEEGISIQRFCEMAAHDLEALYDHEKKYGGDSGQVIFSVAELSPGSTKVTRARTNALEST